MAGFATAGLTCSVGFGSPEEISGFTTGAGAFTGSAATFSGVGFTSTLSGYFLLTGLIRFNF